METIEEAERGITSNETRLLMLELVRAARYAADSIDMVQESREVFTPALTNASTTLHRSVGEKRGVRV